MPDKRRRCTKRCPRCWRNKLRHGNGVKKENGGTLKFGAKQILKMDIPRQTKLKYYKKSNYTSGKDIKIKMKPWRFHVRMLDARGEFTERYKDPYPKK